jgi:tRNA-binding protein
MFLYTLSLARERIVAMSFPPKQIGPFISEVLTLGFTDENGYVVLATANVSGVVGSRIF